MQFPGAPPPHQPNHQEAENNAVAHMEEIMISLGTESASNIDMDQP